MVYVNEGIQNPNRKILWVDAPQLPPTCFYFNGEVPSITPILNTASYLSDLAFEPSKSFEVSWRSSYPQEQNAVWVRAASRKPETSPVTVRLLLYSEFADSEGFSSSAHYLSQNGQHVITVQFPAAFVKSAFLATSIDELEQAVIAFSSEFEIVLSEIKDFLEAEGIEPSEWNLWSENSAVPFVYQGLKTIQQQWDKVVFIDPIVPFGLPNGSKSLIATAQFNPGLIDVDERPWIDLNERFPDAPPFDQVYVGQWRSWLERLEYWRESSEVVLDWIRPTEIKLKYYVPNSTRGVVGSETQFTRSAMNNGAAFLNGKRLPGSR